MNQFLINNKILVPMGDRSVFIDVSEIRHLESVGNHTIIHLQSGKEIMVAVSLQRTTDPLDSNFFARISRKISINIMYVKEITHEPNGTIVIIMDNGDVFKGSRRQALEMRRRFELTFLHRDKQQKTQHP